jgi:hypothetical protein
MRALLQCCLLVLASPLLLAASEAKIVRVWTDYLGAESFDRIGEYFGGAEKHAGRIVLRTQSKERAGFYFLVRLSTREGLSAGKTWRLQVVSPDSDQVRVFNFPFDPSASEKVTQMGLTGSDWTNPKANPVAWRVTLLDATGKELLSSQSYLWR